MLRQILILLLLFAAIACKDSLPKKEKLNPITQESYGESAELTENAEHPSPRMRYKLIQSKSLDRNPMWQQLQIQLGDFSAADYEALKPLILEQNMLDMQTSIAAGKLSYERLTKWYLYRILKFETDKTTSLHSIIALNPNAVAEARTKDAARTGNEHPIFGMPILLKDNINTAEMPTTAGAIALADNETSDAFIVDRIKEKGGIILGKVNLSEWAYFFCQGCPLGYSAIGGQTLNPYGRKVFETGGSSAASGTTMAANYAAAAVGTETSGSILSPSSMNSVVGLKPTIGALSRTGIVPISSTLDTPGPMTRNVTDNAILFSAMTGKDSEDATTFKSPIVQDYWQDLEEGNLEGLRLGVNPAFLEEPNYAQMVEKLQELGAETVEFEVGEMSYEGFVTFLSAEMKRDLPKYLAKEAGEKIAHRSVADVVAFNLKDTTIRMPYGQQHFEGIVADSTSDAALDALRLRFKTEAIAFFETPMQKHNLDAILSINNYNAGQAAMAQYPCLTVPMGYRESGEPTGLTFIARPFEEGKLLRMAYAFEQATQLRSLPEDYK